MATNLITPLRELLLREKVQGECSSCEMMRTTLYANTASPGTVKQGCSWIQPTHLFHLCMPNPGIWPWSHSVLQVTRSRCLKEAQGHLQNGLMATLPGLVCAKEKQMGVCPQECPSLRAARTQCRHDSRVEIIGLDFLELACHILR